MNTDKPTGDPIMNAILDTPQDIFSMAKAHGWTLEQLCACADNPESRRKFAVLSDLADARVHLMAARCRAQVMSRLMNLAMNPIEESPALAEVARKACIELMRINLQPKPMSDADANPVALTEQAIKDLRAQLYDVDRRAAYQNGVLPTADAGGQPPADEPDDQAP